MAVIKQVPFQTRYRVDFSGGLNNYLGSRQIQDNESPSTTDCDFKGKGGVGNRPGYLQLGTNGSYVFGSYGMAEYHTSTLNQLVKFVSNNSNVVLAYNTNAAGSWNYVATTLTDALNVDTVQAVISTAAAYTGAGTGYTGADGVLFTFNGTDAMQKWDGANLGAHTGGKVLLYGAYFDSRLWGVDPTYKDTLWFSCKTPDATKPLDFTADGTSSKPGTISFTPGSGVEITGLKVFKGALYVLTRREIYSMVPASSANTFTISLVTAAIGCVSHRSLCVVENDLYFAASDGIYTMGEVGTFVTVRATNKSLRVQQTFDSLTGPSKQKLVGRFFNYKYHLFYPLFGAMNDSCLVYDIRYQAWHDWRNIAANDATQFLDANKKLHFYFGDPNNSKVYELYNGSTNDGTAINSVWYSKSFDEAAPDLEKLYYDTTFVFGSLGGSVTVSVIFNDSQVSSTKTITNNLPQGGFGRGAFGRSAFGASVNTVVSSNVVNQPLRLKAKGQKFAVQYLVTSSGSWRLDAITQTLIPFSHFKFPSANKLN